MWAPIPQSQSFTPSAESGKHFSVVPMESFSSLIEYVDRYESTTTMSLDIPEVEALEIGRRNLKPSSESPSKKRLKALEKEFGFSFYKHIFNKEDGTLNEFGYSFITRSADYCPDVQLLSSYFSRHKSPVPNIKVGFRDFYSPFTLYRFLRELYDSMAGFGGALKEEGEKLTQVVRKIILSTQSICTLPNYMEMYRKIMAIAQTVPDIDHDLFNEVINSSFSSSVVYPISMPDMDAKEKSRELAILALNKHLVKAYSYLNKGWICEEADHPELFKQGQNRIQKLSHELGYLFSSYPFEESVTFTIKVTWDEAFVGKRLANSTFVCLDYLGSSRRYSIAEPVEIVLPVLEEAQKASIKLYYVLDKYDGTPIKKARSDMLGVLHEFDLVIVSGEYNYNSDFFRRKSARSGKCGTIQLSTSIPKPNDDIKLVKSLDYLLDDLVDSWMNIERDMSPRPPADKFLKVYDLALRYGLPSSVVFVRLLDKLYDGWCPSKSYLSAFAALYLITFMSCKRTSTTERLLSVFNEITEGVKSKAPSMLIQLISNPSHLDDDAIFPLLLLLSFCIPEEHVEDGIQVILTKTVDRILKDVLANLETTPSNTVSKETAKLLEYLPNISGNVEFTPQSLSLSMETLIKRIKELIPRPQEIEDHPIFKIGPIFLSKFKDLSIDLLNCFIAHKFEMGDSMSIRIYFPYREVFEYFTLPDHLSPYKIFYPVILAWIAPVGHKIIEWTSNAVKLDNLEPANKKEFSSSSLLDIMTIITQSFDFIQRLKWKDDNIKDIMETFLSVCCSAINSYFENLGARLFSYFPKDVLSLYADDPHFNYIIKESYNIKNKTATTCQILVICNNFTALPRIWNQFMQDISETMKFDERFWNPAPNAYAIAKLVPQLFAGLVASEVYSNVAPKLWVQNGKLRLLMIKSAAQMVLHPEFLDTRSDYYTSLYQSTVGFIRERIDSMDGHVPETRRHTLTKALIKGLDAGLMNICTQENTLEPIKHKRLEVIVFFIREVHAEIFEYLKTKKSSMTGEEYAKAAEWSTYLSNSMKLTVNQLIDRYLQMPGFEEEKIIFILVSGYNHDKRAMEWSKQQEFRFTSRPFRPQLKKTDQ